MVSGEAIKKLDASIFNWLNCEDKKDIAFIKTPKSDIDLDSYIKCKDKYDCNPKRSLDKTDLRTCPDHQIIVQDEFDQRILEKDVCTDELQLNSVKVIKANPSTHGDNKRSNEKGNKSVLFNELESDNIRLNIQPRDEDERTKKAKSLQSLANDSNSFDSKICMSVTEERIHSTPLSKRRSKGVLSSAYFSFISIISQGKPQRRNTGNY